MNKLSAGTVSTRYVEQLIFVLLIENEYKIHCDYKAFRHKL